MITKRKFFAMALTMFALFFLFQFSQIMKERSNEYDVNDYARVSNWERESAWDPQNTGTNGEDKSVLLIGNKESRIAEVAREWCTYTKRKMEYSTNVEKCSEKQLARAEVILLESAYVTGDKEVSLLLNLVKKGKHLIFCDLPEVERIEESKDWRLLLGISKVRARSEKIEGVNLFAGFLLGGQGIYCAKDETEARERQDLDLLIPWFETGTGCKTYMVGMLSDSSVKNEQLPAIIWRNGVGEGKVFAVNGEYMKDYTGIGILDAMMAELHDYEVYPVVNAQSLSVANFPELTEENTVQMKEIYSRNQQLLFQDILWPGICSLIEKEQIRLTGYLAPQLDYKDYNDPKKEELIFYLKQMKEQRAEVGLSFDYEEAENLDKKIEEDQSFFKESKISYRYRTAYIPGDQMSTGIDLLKDKKHLGEICTVSGEYSEKRPILSYLEDDITFQSITSQGTSHTYSDDIRMRSLQTALGYSNVLLDLKQVVYPQKEEDRWETISSRFSSKIHTYWKNFRIFEKTTASESDRKIRDFLALDYEVIKSGNQIHLNVKKRNSEAWFLLRTHGEKVKSVQGGEAKEIEKDAYLIRVFMDHVNIQCEKRDSLYYVFP